MVVRLLLLVVGTVVRKRKENKKKVEFTAESLFGGRDSRICSSPKPICRRRPYKRVDAIGKENSQ